MKAASCHKDKKHFARGLCSICYWQCRRSEPNYIKRKSLRERYGLSLETYNQMLEEYGHKCAICREVKKSRLCVDHDHITGRVRGLLCQHCNWYVGLLDRNPEALTRLCLYGKTDRVWGRINY